MTFCPGSGPIRSSGDSGRIAEKTASCAKSSSSSISSARAPMYYRGRDMTLTHRGMRINDSDWNVFLGRAAATLAKFQVPEAEQRDVVAFVQSLKKECVEC
jgi:hypothetical protein